MSFGLFHRCIYSARAVTIFSPFFNQHLQCARCTSSSGPSQRTFSLSQGAPYAYADTVTCVNGWMCPKSHCSRLLDRSLLPTWWRAIPFCLHPTPPVCELRSTIAAPTSSTHIIVPLYSTCILSLHSSSCTSSATPRF